MQIVTSIPVPRKGPAAVIKLGIGDLSAIPASEAVDLLVVSAFPDNYVPTRTSLIGALQQRGISVEKLAASKALDLRAFSSCWLSKPVAGNGFKQILCFEPVERGKAAEVVGDIFRSIVPIATGPALKRVALPLVASGNRGESAIDMLTALLDAAFNWLSNGLPLDSILIAAFDPSSEKMLLDAAAKFQPIEPTRPVHSKAFDLFISYCHADKAEVDLLVDRMLALKPTARLFVDRRELKLGSAWQQEIFEALDASKKVLTAFSPAYLTSKVCKEEFNMAYCRHREEVGGVLLPVYVRTTDLPTYMRLIQYTDCREGDRAKLEQAANLLAGMI